MIHGVHSTSLFCFFVVLFLFSSFFLAFLSLLSLLCSPCGLCGWSRLPTCEMISIISYVDEKSSSRFHVSSLFFSLLLFLCGSFPFLILFLGVFYPFCLFSVLLVDSVGGLVFPHVR
eukprot:TRINITY_DN746_c0_g1_i1.p1 TRINITY_DN746_c0_g1~~TRINITY_DN746_c0_g1_i1.p1  ORF type:complete len:117 (+),score=32.33 TRINITY_DN746_c0_g1_i1:177-527(+)